MKAGPLVHPSLIVPEPTGTMAEYETVLHWGSTTLPPTIIWGTTWGRIVDP